MAGAQGAQQQPGLLRQARHCRHLVVLQSPHQDLSLSLSLSLSRRHQTRLISGACMEKESLDMDQVTNVGTRVNVAAQNCALLQLLCCDVYAASRNYSTLMLALRAESAMRCRCRCLAPKNHRHSSIKFEKKQLDLSANRVSNAKYMHNLKITAYTQTLCAFLS